MAKLPPGILGRDFLAFLQLSFGDEIRAAQAIDDSALRQAMRAVAGVLMLRPRMADSFVRLCPSTYRLAMGCGFRREVAGAHDAEAATT
ncbi:hypothetical protein M3A49_07855 [Paraburkholderia sp. CNPSo 3076]|uniref:hypothetical protein n=1 Tax=Paraburkholderia sp. CNPSo 3076 TaxID=2940936 RepID=UPI0022574627|nr:hypothetical protein [Paraburkholderia sp. CNPSo 3076]MCX5539405.1 hypothetical protein [Paraburkholderia sp. CNPSo 3076]